jgi:tellurite resistance protein TehA-like permease
MSDRPAHPPGPLATFSPAYFALVMATGIVSIASGFLGFSLIARVLFAINLAAYVTIWGLHLGRLFRHPRRMLADLASHERGAGFLTVVAATALVGSECHLRLGADTVALALWFFAIGLWAVLLNAWFAAAVMVDPKPTLDRGIDGSWFLLTVSTQSIAVLGTYVANQFSVPEHVLFACLAFYMLGAMFYLWVVSLVLLRWLFFPMDRRDALSPNYWINSGAMAITTLAGARLIATTSPHVASLAHFLSAFNLLFWVTASWWIPLLFLVNAWRLFIERFPLRYEPGYWSMVFPLGMYAACTWAYAQSADIPLLEPIARGGIFVAWAAWALTALGMLKTFLRWMRPRRHLHVALVAALGTLA